MAAATDQHRCRNCANLVMKKALVERRPHQGQRGDEDQKRQVMEISRVRVGLVRGLGAQCAVLGRGRSYEAAVGGSEAVWREDNVGFSHAHKTSTGARGDNWYQRGWVDVPGRGDNERRAVSWICGEVSYERLIRALARRGNQEQGRKAGGKRVEGRGGDLEGGRKGQVWAGLYNRRPRLGQTRWGDGVARMGWKLVSRW